MEDDTTIERCQRCGNPVDGDDGGCESCLDDLRLREEKTHQDVTPDEDELIEMERINRFLVNTIEEQEERYCPTCFDSFTELTEVCPECMVNLLETHELRQRLIMRRKEIIDERWVVILITTDQRWFSVVTDHLEAGGIDYRSESQPLQQTVFPWMRIPSPAIGTTASPPTLLENPSWYTERILYVQYKTVDATKQLIEHNLADHEDEDKLEKLLERLAELLDTSTQ